MGGSAIVLLLFVLIIAAVEVGGTLVFVGAAVVLVSGDEVSHVARGVLVQLLVVSKNKDGDIDRTENGELVSLFEQATLSFQKGDRTIPVILDGFNLNLSSPHGDCLCILDQGWGSIVAFARRAKRGVRWRRGQAVTRRDGGR